MNFTVNLTIEERDGQTYISSDGVPGLWLWGGWDSVIPAIQSLKWYNDGVRVEPVAITFRMVGQ